MVSPCRLTRRAVAACAAASIAAFASTSVAAPADYATIVAADAPFAHYRFDQGGAIAAGSTLPDVSPNARHATYQGTGAAGVAGVGLGGDRATSFTGGAAGPYVAATSLREFGASIGQSTYEFLFRTNAVNPTGGITLFGAFNRVDGGADPTGNVAVSVDLNLSATGGTANGSTRLFIRGADNRSLSGVINSPLLRDGLFHHLAFTYDDRNAGGVGDLIRAYVDGVPQLVTEVNVNGSGVPTAYGDFEFAPSFAARQNRDASGAVYDLRANVTLDEAALYTVALTPADVAAHAVAALAALPSVPEPASLAALVAVGLVTFRRRRRTA